jgi:hypothetical protein
MRAENQRIATENPASTTASPAMNRAMRMMSPAVPSRVAIRLTMSPASSGVTTPITEDAVTRSRNRVRSRRYGRAKDRTRRTVPLGSLRVATVGSLRNDRIAIMAGLLTRSPLSHH